MIQIKPDTSAAYNLFHNGILALAKAEQQGLRIDMNYANSKIKELTADIQNLEQEFKNSKFYRDWTKSRTSIPNIYSNQQLSHFLYNVKKIPPIKTTVTGKGATDEDALEGMNLPELYPLLRIRKLMKIRDTYLSGFVREQVNGYIHPFFNLHKVRTFRGSCDSPNFQNIPKRDKETMLICRKAIYPRPGHQLLELDFKALEVSIAACYHQDPTMLKYLKDPSTDMHADMAEQIFFLSKYDENNPEHNILRNATKNGFVFPQFYGDYYKNNAISMAGTWGKLPESKWKPGQGIPFNSKNLSDHFIQHKINSMDSFILHIKGIEKDFWGNRFPVYRDWKEKWWSNYQKAGYINMFSGFTCKGVMGRNDCINYPVQGAAFHCLLWTFIRLSNIIESKKWKSRLVGQIHDAIVIDVYPPELEELTLNARLVSCGDLVNNWKWITVPLTIKAEVAGIDESWADLKSYPLP